MAYVVIFVFGALVGALVIVFYQMKTLDAVKKRERAAETSIRAAGDAQAATASRETQLAEWAQGVEASAQEQARHLEHKAKELAQKESHFEQRVVSYRELRDENTLLKRDLQNIDVNLHKLELDGADRERRQREIDERSNVLAKRYLAETVKSIGLAIGADNFTSCKQRLLDAIARVRGIGFNVPVDEEVRLLEDLRREFEKQVRLTIEREEQARIKAQIRDDERLKREIDRELKRLERERLIIQAALDQALAEANGQHSAQVDELKRRLTEAEESKRKMSMAEMTKAGHVYVISNIGTFGQDVYKIGMTRRLDPQERVDELGSASVPFPFDVHMMVSCQNAPSLENALHRALHKQRINKANPRKEFFRVTLDSIRTIVEAHHGNVDYIAMPEALQYWQSQNMSEDEADYIGKVFEQAECELSPGQVIED